ncbi:hypothetical protein [Alkalihalobacillus sp. 1P02AB]|uniref:hypothetical protein n=1 Tax=Alkalihalobacillus sp. 1P02AB TaxID=3132260 RepID=UPI0039A601C7
MKQHILVLISNITAILFIVLIFMYYLDLWTASSFIQILFFFIMVAVIYQAGFTFAKYLNRKAG